MGYNTGHRLEIDTSNVNCGLVVLEIQIQRNLVAVPHKYTNPNGCIWRNQSLFHLTHLINGIKLHL